MMMDEEVRTYHVAQETTVNGVTITMPWVQRQANGAVIARLHISSPQYTAGELLLSEQDLTALDEEERPLRTQVRRVWGYSLLKDVTPPLMQTARFDVGFRADIAATRGKCGLVIAIIRAFRPAEGPKALGGPWLFKFPIADESEVEAARQAEAARLEAVRQEAAQREASRLERIRLENARLEAARLERMAALRPSEPVIPPRGESTEAPLEQAPSEGQAAEGQSVQQAQDRSRRPSRFSRGERGPRRELPSQPPELGEATERPEMAPTDQTQAPAEPAPRPAPRFAERQRRDQHAPELQPEARPTQAMFEQERLEASPAVAGAPAAPAASQEPLAGEAPADAARPSVEAALPDASAPEPLSEGPQEPAARAARPRAPRAAGRRPRRADAAPAAEDGAPAPGDAAGPAESADGA